MTYDLLLRAWVAVQATRIATTHRLATDERGEGVISAAIAVLVMAFLGVAMWIGFRLIFQHTSEQVDQQVTKIGQ
jgi:type VI protein secretion system component VasF